MHQRCVEYDCAGEIYTGEGYTATKTGVVSRLSVVFHSGQGAALSPSAAFFHYPGYGEGLPGARIQPGFPAMWDLLLRGKLPESSDRRADLDKLACRRSRSAAMTAHSRFFECPVSDYFGRRVV